MARKSVKDAIATPEGLAALNFDAAFDDKEMEEMEKGAQGAQHGITRRMALAALTCDKARLVEGFTKDEESRDLLAKMIENITDYIAHLKAVTETMEAAQARLFCVAGSIVLHDEASAS